MLELLGLAVWCIAALFGAAPMVALHTAIVVLLWSQVALGAVGFILQCIWWFFVTVGGAAGGAKVAGQKAAGLGALAGAGIAGAAGLWSIAKFLFRKGLLIGAILMVLSAGPAGTLALLAGLMYGVGAFWSWKNDWDGVKTGWKSISQG